MRFLCRELADRALLAFLLKTAFLKELRSVLLLYSGGKTNGHIGDIQFASDRHWTLFRSKSHIVPTSYGQPFPYISSLIFILTQTHFSNKQSTLITIVPAASDFGFLSGSAPSASPESQTQYHFLHRTPLALLRFSSSKSSNELPGGLLPVIGVFPPVKHALVNEIIQIMLTKTELFEKLR